MNLFVDKVWEATPTEHGINPTGTYYDGSDLLLECINDHLNESIAVRYVPRVILLDLEAGNMNPVCVCPL